MPFVGKAIVIDPVWRAEGQSVVGAANEHDISCASTRRLHTGQHINVIVSQAARVINRQEQHSIQPCRIYSTTRQVAAHIDVLGYLIKSRCLAPDLRIARANAGKGVAFSADKKIAVGIHIERPVCRPAWNNDWSLPGNPAVGRSLELDAVAATINSVARLILEAVPRTAGLIDGKPLLVAATREALGLKLCP
jgi:hypothetical protein